MRTLHLAIAKTCETIGSDSSASAYERTLAFESWEVHAHNFGKIGKKSTETLAGEPGNVR